MIEKYENNSVNVLTLTERQISYEHMYDRKQSRKLIKENLPNIEDKIVLDILSILVLRNSRVSTSAIIEMLAERNMLQESVENIVTRLFQLAGENILTVSSDEKRRLYFKCNFSLKQEVLDLLHQYQYKLPMLVEPLPLNQKGNNRGNGYYLNGSQSLILNNSHDKDIDHKVLERFNRIPFTLNLSLIKNVPNSFKNMEHKNTLENFERYERLIANSSAILLNNGNKFYFTHSYDKRGRIYCNGYQHSYQMNSWQKASLEFANKDYITEEVLFF